ANVTNEFDETPAGGSFNISAITGTTLTLSTSGELFYTNFNLSIGSPGNAGTVQLNMSDGAIANGDAFNVGIIAVNDGTLDTDEFLSQITNQYQESIATGATLNYNGLSSTVLELTGAGTAQLGTNPVMTLTLESAEFTGVITGSGNLVLGNAVVLFGKNTYSGSTTLNGGLVGAGNASAFSSGAVTVAGATTLYAAGADQTIANPITINSGQTLTIGVDTTATHTLTLSGAITNGGSAAINAASGAILEYGPGESLVGFVLGGTGTQMLSDETSLVGVTVNNGLTIFQDGSTTLTNFTNGGTFVNNSTLTWNGGTNGVSGVLDVNAGASVNAFSSYGTIDIVLSGTLTNTATNLFLAGGSLMEIGSPAAPGGNLTLQNGTTLEVNGASLINDGTITGTTDVNFGGVAQGNGAYGPVNIASGGAFAPGLSGTAHGTAGAVVDNGAFNMTAGKESIASITGVGLLALSGGATLTINSNSGKNSVGSLSIDAAHGSHLDLNNGALFINYGAGTDPIASIAAYIKSGYANGAWTGPGIMSTTDQTAMAYGIGYADGADGVVAGLSSGQIEIRYTLYGDANLDGVVSGVDFTILAGNLNKVVSGWDKGDFNYDGVVSGQDFTALIGNLGKAANGGSVELPAADYAAIDAFAVANGLMADVPEPASCIVIPGLAVLLARRRRVER
ncbi:MAG TPA: dockerin type I domain-containing protein, partial [Tepidisphaeraceae bacterium]